MAFYGLQKIHFRDNGTWSRWTAEGGSHLRWNTMTGFMRELPPGASSLKTWNSKC